MKATEAATLKPGDRMRMVDETRRNIFWRAFTGIFIRQHPRDPTRIMVERDLPGLGRDYWHVSAWEREP